MKSLLKEYLGVHCNYQIKWDKLIEHLTSKIKYLLFIFSKFVKCMQTKALVMIYYALFHSANVCTNGIIAWDGAYKTILLSIQAVQRRILKIIIKISVNVS